MRPLTVLFLIIFSSFPSLADDGAASIAAGGIVLMKRETRIVMAKEVLSISPTKVIVDYDFRNDSSQDISTEVAFPVPSYTRDPGWWTYQSAGFDNFKLWVDGQPLAFTVEARAFVGKREVTALLRQLHVDIATFGHLAQSGDCPDLYRLERKDRQRLTDVGALESVDNMTPLWRVEKKYHWLQSFAAHKVVHIRHEYTPVIGGGQQPDLSPYNGKKQEYEEIASLCPTPEILRSASRMQAKANYLEASYVDFILTTANTWKTPIEDFTLIVERPSNKYYAKSYVSFCWDGPVTKINANHFSAHIDGLVPKKELRVGWLGSRDPGLGD